MFISEFIVGLWFVPVVLFVVIPLAALCAWSAHQLLRICSEAVTQMVRKLTSARDDSPSPTFRPRAAV